MIIKILYYIIIFLALSYYACTQNFRVEPTKLEIIKTTDFLYMYDYAEVINLTDSILHIGWSKKYLTELPFLWETSVACPSGFHDDTHISEATFFLETYPTFNNKLICHAYPNGNFGELEVEFELYELDNPTEKISLLFKFTVYDKISSVIQVQNCNFVLISQTYIHFTENVKYFYLSDTGGKILAHGNGDTNLQLASIPTGAYIVAIMSNDGQRINHKFIKF